jgi:hypothetical protein
MVLNGWKEIARHFRCGVRTVQRWEHLGLGLPVHRPRQGPGPVCAFSVTWSALRMRRVEVMPAALR